MKVETNSPRVAWGPVSAVLGTLVLFFGSQLVVGVIITAVLVLFGWSDTRINAWFENGGNSGVFILSAALALIELGGLFAYLSYKRAHPRDIGLIRPKLSDLGYMLKGTVLYVGAHVLIINVLAGLIPRLDTEQTQDLGFTVTQSSNELVLIFISLVVIPPLVEEVLVRGYLYSGLRSKFTFWYAAFISSALFGLAHLFGGENGSAIWIAVLDTFTLGMILAYLREKTGSLWAPIGLHALKNFIAFMALFVFKVT